jgi:hypothetical protein
MVARPDRTLRDDAIVAALAGAIASAIPSTAWSLARGDDVLDGARAAGAMLLPHERRTLALLAAAVPVHLALSAGWAGVITAAIPPRAEPVWGVLAGLGIATLDLVVIGRHIPSIRALPQGRQWADHIAYGFTVGFALQVRRRRRATASARDDRS